MVLLCLSDGLGAVGGTSQRGLVGSLWIHEPVVPHAGG